MGADRMARDLLQLDDDRDRFALVIDSCIEEVGYLDHCIATRDAIASFATA
jgi:hypothetical protein